MGRCNRHAKHCTDCNSLSFVESPAFPTRKRRSPLFQSSPILKKVPSVSLALVSNNWVESGFQFQNNGGTVADYKSNSPPKKKSKSKRRMNFGNSTAKTNKKFGKQRYSPLEFIPSSTGSTPPTDKESSPENCLGPSSDKDQVAAMDTSRDRVADPRNRALTSTGNESCSLPENIQGISSINSVDCDVLGKFLQGTPCQSWASTGEILVEDTPPQFYGFTIKQRQRLEMQKCKLGT